VSLIIPIVGRPNVVFDTNVLVAATRSQRGASFRLLSLVGRGKFDLTISVPLVLEYEDVLLREPGATSLPEAAIQDILDYVCSVALQQDVFFLWRPFLPDPKDDLVLEAAVAGRCDAIVTYNRRDFVGIEKFGLRTLLPGEFLQEIGGAT
jgi:putative PIN family toxin of toxin-antitoxin system